MPAHRKLRIWQIAASLRDHALDPVFAVFLAMPIEEYINILWHIQRRKDVRISAIIQNVYSLRPHLPQQVGPACAIGNERIVFCCACTLIYLKSAGESGEGWKAGG